VSKPGYRRITLERVRRDVRHLFTVTFGCKVTSRDFIVEIDLALRRKIRMFSAMCVKYGQWLGFIWDIVIEHSNLGIHTLSIPRMVGCRCSP
jgi:hypothetical protein